MLQYVEVAFKVETIYKTYEKVILEIEKNHVTLRAWKDNKEHVCSYTDEVSIAVIKCIDYIYDQIRG